jgi:hypothetical protein
MNADKTGRRQEKESVSTEGVAFSYLRLSAFIRG